MRRHKIDLELGAGRNLSRLLQPPKVRIGSLGDVGVEQIVETDVLRPKSWLERVALAPGAARVHAKEFARFYEGGMLREYRFEPRNPVSARSGLAVR
jgi:hypothetical protein